MDDHTEDAETFEPIRDTKHGDGSARAANKGSVKRKLRGSGTNLAKKKHRKTRRSW